MSAGIIVVTGGICSGKSVIASRLAEKGGYLIDADREAHEVYREPLLKERLRERFGDRVFTPAGAVSRKVLGAMVFEDRKMLQSLNRIVRPYVKKRISEIVRERKKKEKYIVLDAILFFQYKFRFKVDMVILAEASKEACLDRIVKRDSYSVLEAEKRIEMQRGLRREWERADITINTDREIQAVLKEVDDVLDGFLKKRCR